MLKKLLDYLMELVFRITSCCRFKSKVLAEKILQILLHPITPYDTIS